MKNIFFFWPEKRALQSELRRSLDKPCARKSHRTTLWLQNSHDYGVKKLHIFFCEKKLRLQSELWTGSLATCVEPSDVVKQTLG